MSAKSIIHVHTKSQLVCRQRYNNHGKNAQNSAFIDFIVITNVLQSPIFDSFISFLTIFCVSFDFEFHA